jgi:arsenate reductase
MSTVLFVCRHNAGRSQMSEALFTRAAGSRHQSLSAGTTPAAHVHPEVIAVMRELGIDLAGRTPKQLTPELAREADIVITMGCGDQCPFIPGKRYIDWDLADPAGLPPEECAESVMTSKLASSSWSPNSTKKPASSTTVRGRQPCERPKPTQFSRTCCRRAEVLDTRSLTILRSR